MATDRSVVPRLSCIGPFDKLRAGSSARRTAAAQDDRPFSCRGLFVATNGLFFGARLWGNESGDAVVDDELAVVFAGMFDETVGHVEDAHFLVGEGIHYQVGHSFIAFGLNGGGAVGEGLFYEGNDVGFGFVVVRAWGLLPASVCPRPDW